MPAKPSTTEVDVVIDSSLRVPLVLPVLASIDDGALRREIAEEAVRLAVAEKLCGFDGIKVSETTPTQQHPHAGYRATVDFNQLSRCIGALQAEYQRVMAIARDAQQVVEEIKVSCSSSGAGETATTQQLPGELQASINTLSIALNDILCQPTVAGSEDDSDRERGGAGAMPELVAEGEEVEAGRRLLDGSDDDDDAADLEDEDYSDPVAAGYSRMADD